MNENAKLKEGHGFITQCNLQNRFLNKKNEKMQGVSLISHLGSSSYRACACDVAFHAPKPGVTGFVEIGSLLLKSCSDDVRPDTLLVHDWASRALKFSSFPMEARFLSPSSSRAVRRVRGIVTLSLIPPFSSSSSSSSSSPSSHAHHVVVLRCVARQIRSFAAVLKPGHILGVSVAGEVWQVRVLYLDSSVDCELRVQEEMQQLRPVTPIQSALEECFAHLLLPRLVAMRDGCECKLVVVSGRGMMIESLLEVIARKCLGLAFLSVEDGGELLPEQQDTLVCIQGLEHPDADTGRLRSWLSECFSKQRRQVPVIVCTSLGLLPSDVRSGCVAQHVLPPTWDQRRILLQSMITSGTIDDETIDSTGGFSVSDLQRLAAAASQCVGGFGEARRHVRPQLLSELSSLSAEDEDVSWSRVIGCDGVKRALERGILWPLRHPHLVSQFGLRSGGGILVYGPSGCGKSLVVAAFAASCKINLVQMSAGQLTSKYTGETEAQIRSLFASCRAVAPCVLALDEFDQLASSRDDEAIEDTGGALQRSVSTLLNELDGLDTGGVGGSGVFFVALSNRPWLLDAAILRPGRIDSMV